MDDGGGGGGGDDPLSGSLGGSEATAANVRVVVRCRPVLAHESLVG